MTRRREVTPDGIAYETCDPEPTDPRTKEALENMVIAAVKHIRDQQRTRWEYHQEPWDLEPSIAQAMQRLTNMGEDGWELVTITAPPTATINNAREATWRLAIYKRPLSHPARASSDDAVYNHSSSPGSNPGSVGAALAPLVEGAGADLPQAHTSQQVRSGRCRCEEFPGGYCPVHGSPA